MPEDRYANERQSCLRQIGDELTRADMREAIRDMQMYHIPETWDGDYIERIADGFDRVRSLLVRFSECLPVPDDEDDDITNDLIEYMEEVGERPEVS